MLVDVFKNETISTNHTVEIRGETLVLSLMDNKKNRFYQDKYKIHHTVDLIYNYLLYYSSVTQLGPCPYKYRSYLICPLFTSKFNIMISV